MPPRMRAKVSLNGSLSVCPTALCSTYVPLPFRFRREANGNHNGPTARVVFEMSLPCVNTKRAARKSLLVHSEVLRESATTLTSYLMIKGPQLALKQEFLKLWSTCLEPSADLEKHEIFGVGFGLLLHKGFSPFLQRKAGIDLPVATCWLGSKVWNRFVRCVRLHQAPLQDCNLRRLKSTSWKKHWTARH